MTRIPIYENPSLCTSVIVLGNGYHVQSLYQIVQFHTKANVEMRIKLIPTYNIQHLGTYASTNPSGLNQIEEKDIRSAAHQTSGSPYPSGNLREGQHLSILIHHQVAVG